MLPFGNTPFGQGYFGRGDWGRRVFWQNVPGEQQMLDVDGYLEGLLKAWGDEYEAILQQVLTLPQQRDPFQVRASGTITETMLVTQVVTETDATYGAVVKLIEERDPSALPTGYLPISQVGPAWLAEFEDGRWPVVLVRTRNFDTAAYYNSSTSLGNEVWCSTGTLLPFSYTGEAVGTGDGTAAPAVAVLRSVRFAANPDPAFGIATAGVAVHLTGSISGALWAYDNGIGELRDDVGGFAVGSLRGTVDYDDGTIALDVDHDVPGEVVVPATAITATYTVRGYYVRMRPQSMLEWLHKDFGLIADTGAPDDVQRAALAHYPHYMARKGAGTSYQVLGGIYLFTVTATGIYSVGSFAQVADYPPLHVFAIGGKTFTDIDPRRVRYDDLAGDLSFFDFFGDHAPVPPAPGLVPLLDREVLFDDTTIPPVGDGWSVAKGFCADIAQGYHYPGRNPATIVDAVALTAAELVFYGLPSGFKVTVAMTQTQKDVFNFTGRGRFALTCYDKVGLVPPDWTTTPYWIDAEDTSAFAHGWDPGALTWTIVVGASSIPASWPAGAPGVRDVAVRYLPGIDLSDCAYCRTSYVRIRILPTAEGEAHYGASLAPGAKYTRARERLQARIEELIKPSHVRVLEFVYT